MLVGEDTTLDGVEQDACIKALWRQAKRYHEASLQDRNPLIAARHNGYAAALMDVLFDIATEEEAKRLTGESLRAFRQEVLAHQDRFEGTLFELVKKAGLKTT